jgi:hypothetical protein
MPTHASPILSVLSFCLVITAPLGCGDDEARDSDPLYGSDADSDTDTDSDTDADADADADVDEGMVGRFRVEEHYDQLYDEHSGIVTTWGPLTTPWEPDIVGDWSFGCIEKPGDRGLFRIRTAEGECELSVWSDCDGDCEPSCPSEHYCLGGETCIHEPTVGDAGTITVEGLAEPLEIPFEGSYQVLWPPAELFEPGDEVTLTAPGASFPAFQASLVGVDPLEASLPCDAVPDPTQDLTITWTPSGREGARVRWEMMQEIHLAMGPRIRCETDDDGSFTLPSGLLQAYMVTERQTLVLTRFTQERVETDQGRHLDFELASSVGCVINDHINF